MVIKTLHHDATRFRLLFRHFCFRDVMRFEADIVVKSRVVHCSIPIAAETTCGDIKTELAVGEQNAWTLCRNSHERIRVQFSSVASRFSLKIPCFCLNWSPFVAPFPISTFGTAIIRWCASSVRMALPFRCRLSPTRRNGLSTRWLLLTLPPSSHVGFEKAGGSVPHPSIRPVRSHTEPVLPGRRNDDRPGSVLSVILLL